MPSLTELKSKWFIDLSDSSGFPPKGRYPTPSGSGLVALQPHTDGNRVLLRIDGQNYMREWNLSLTAVSGTPDTELYHAGWRFENVRTLGDTNTTSGALDQVTTVQAAGNTTPYIVLSRHAAGIQPNSLSVARLRTPPNSVWTAVLDNRFPVAGSNHFKYVCFKKPTNPKALVGSIDISTTRWDTTSHSPTDPDRPNPPTHDVGIMVEGPVVADIERSFRNRWNDSTRTFGLEPLLPPLARITTPISTPAAVGTHSVQVLHTYGRTSTFYGYSWSPTGEFTVWASYLKAIRQASNYIYIEDQYFLPFDYPPCFRRTGRARDTDIIYQLGEAIKRGVKVAVLVPQTSEDSTRVYQVYQRDLGVRYLQGIAAAHPGDFVIAYLHNGTTNVYVHAKLMLVDDEFTLVGSANIGQRSMTFDGELQLGVIDQAEQFTRDFRNALWEEHLQINIPNDPNAAYTLFKNRTNGNQGRVRRYTPIPASTSAPIGHGRAIRNLIDPYGGPPR